MRTQVVIIGGGPSGLLLAQLLQSHGIDSIVLERRTRAHVLSRIRAGVLETGLLDLLDQAGAGDRVRREGIPHDGTLISYGDEVFRIDFARHTGRSVMVYGQTEVTQDLYAARDKTGGQTEFEVDDVRIIGADTDTPSVTYWQAGSEYRIACDFIAGCDGFHGVSRASIPDAAKHIYEKTYPFGWLGILSETPPSTQNSSMPIRIAALRCVPCAIHPCRATTSNAVQTTTSTTGAMRPSGPS